MGRESVNWLLSCGIPTPWKANWKCSSSMVSARMGTNRGAGNRVKREEKGEGEGASFQLLTQRRGKGGRKVKECH